MSETKKKPKAVPATKAPKKKVWTGFDPENLEEMTPEQTKDLLESAVTRVQWLLKKRKRPKG